jgi:hypothetical protein
VKFKLRNFTTSEIFGYVVDQSPKVSNSQKCKVMMLRGPSDLKQILCIVCVVDDVAYAMWQGFPVRTRVTQIWYLLDPNLFFF